MLTRKQYELLMFVHERLKENLGDAPYLSDPLQPGRATEQSN